MISRRLRVVCLGVVLMTQAAIAGEHPLDTLHLRWPPHPVITQLTDIDGVATFLTGDPNGNRWQLDPSGAWLPVTTGLPGIEQLHTSGTQQLALAGGKTWHRVAGEGWSEIPPPAAGALVEVRVAADEFWAWTAGGFHRVDSVNTLLRSRLFRSVDGQAWTEAIVSPAPEPGTISYSDLRWADGLYVLTGNAYQMVDPQLQHAGGLWTSPDGITWERQSEVDGVYTSAAFGNGMWLAGGTNGKFATSPDGAEWTRHQHDFIYGYIGNADGSYPQRSSLIDVIWLLSGFHALTQGFSSRDLIVVSPDGLNWSSGEALPYDDFPEPAALTAIDGKAWLSGQGGTVWNSADWRWGQTRILPEESSDWSVVLASPDRAVVLGNEQRAAWSDDGVGWQFVDLPGASSRPADGVWAADRQEFLAVGSVGAADLVPDAVRLWRSADGIEWGTRTLWGTALPVGLERGHGRYVLTLANGVVYHSVDGVAWTSVWFGEGLEKLSGLAFDGETFVAIKARGGLLVSSDGINWTSESGPAEFPQDVQLGICYGGGAWIVSGGSSTFISSDLRTWSSASSNISQDGLTFAHGEFVSSGWTGVSSSQDGLSWARRGGDFHQRIAPVEGANFGDTMLFAGDNGRIRQSDPWRDFVTEWMAANFSVAQLADSTISADDADPDGDGVPNLLEYALGLNPFFADGREAVSQDRVRYGTNGSEFDTYLRLIFPNWEESAGVRVWAESSSDLRTWHRSGIRTGTVWSQGGRRIWTRELKVDGNQGWLRLRAVRP